jgi:FKBP-type peptidyl-prolyl cis-trans isomerase 2
MEKEKIITVALVVILIAALSVALASLYYEDIFENLFEGETPAAVIEAGDCADVNYIGRYADNNTIFDSSYQFPENKTGGSPLNIFVTLNKTLAPPEGYESYSQQFIDGLMEGLIGLEEGEEATIGPIPPEKAYGDNPAEIGDQFTTTTITASNYGYELESTVEIINMSQDAITLKWVDIDQYGNFTMPEGILLEDLASAFFSLYDSNSYP